MVNESALALLTKRTSEITEKNEARQKSFEDSKKSLEAEKRRRDGIGDGRWQNRRAFGCQKTRKGPNWIGTTERAKENLAKRQAKARPRKYRLRRRRPCGVKSAAKAHGGPHKRLTLVELRRGLAQGKFQSWMADQVKDALKEGSTRAVVMCRCGSLTTFTQADKAEETWAEHVKKTDKPKIERSLKMYMPLFGKDKRDRRAILKRARRMQRQAYSGGLLAQLRCSMSGQIPATQMSTITAAAGGGNWSAGGTWNGGIAPTSADDAILASTSGSVTVDSNAAACRSLSCTATGNYAATLNLGGFTLNVGDASGGAITLASTMTLTFGGINASFVLVSTSTNGGLGWGLTTAGKSMAWTFSGAGGKWVFQDSSTSAGNITLNNGTLDTNNQTFSVGAFSSSNSNIRVLTMGSSSMALTSGSWNIGTATNLTITANTSIVTLSSAAANFTSSSVVLVNGMSVVLSGSGLGTVSNAQTFANLTRTGTAVKTDGFGFNTTGVTVTGTLTINGNSNLNRMLVQSNTFGSTRSISAATVVVTNSDFQDITGTGAGSWNLSAITGLSGDAGGNSGITFTTSATQTWSGTSGGNWSTNAWTSRVPLPQDDVVINAAFGASQTITIDMPRWGRDVSFSGMTGAVALLASPASIVCAMYGSLTLASSLVWTSGTGFTLLLQGRGAKTITSNGNIGGSPAFYTVRVNSSGGSYTIQDAQTASWSFVVDLGTYNANNQNLTVWSFSSSNSGPRTITMGSGAWSLIGSAATVWNTATITNLTLNVNTAVVSTTSVSGTTNTATITTGGITMPSFTVNTNIAITTQFSDAFTTAGTITLTAGKLDTNNQTVSAARIVVGASGNVATRVATLGSSSITCTQTGGTPAWDAQSTTGLTITGGTSTITFTGSGPAWFSGSSANCTYNNVVFSSLTSGGQIAFGGSTTTVASLTFTGTATKTAAFQFSSHSPTIASMTVTGNSSINRMFLQSATLGSARTLTVNTTVTSTNADWQDITAAGTASWNISAATGGSGDALGNTGITFTTAATQFWFSGTGNWSDNTKWFLATAGGGGAGRVPLPQDNVRFDSTSFTAGSQTVTMDMPRFGANIDWTGVTNNPTWAQNLATGAYMYGSWTGIAGTTRGGWSGALNFAGRSAGLTITTGSNTNNMPGSQWAAFGGIYTLQDAFNTGGGIMNVQDGTLNANNQAVTTTAFDLSSLAHTRTITMGSGAWSLTRATAAFAWTSASSLLTLNINTAIVSCTGAPGGAITTTVTTGGVSMPNFTVNGGANLTVQFSDAFTTTGTVTLTQAKLDTNGQTCNWGIWSGSGSSTRTLTLGSSAVTITTGAGNGWNNSTATSMTLTANTSTITLSGADANFGGGGLTTYNNVVITSAGTPVIASSFTAVNFTRTGTAVKTDKLSFAAGATSNVITGTFTITGNSTVNRMFVQSATLGTTRTITCNGSCAHSNVDWQDITAAGTGAPFTGTSMGDALGNSNITFDAPVTRYGVVAGNWSSTATWSNVSGGAGGFSVPLPQDTVILDASSAAGTYTADMPRIGLHVTMTGFTRTAAFTSTSNTIFGNLILASGMTLTSGSTFMTFAGRGAQTLTSAGKSLPGNAAFAAFGGTYTLQDAFSETGGTFFASNGTFAANSQTVAIVQFSSGSVNTRTVTMGSGAWSITGSGSVAVWNTSSTLTLTVTSNTTSFTGTSGTNTITTGAVTMPNCTFNGAGGTWQFQDAFTTAGTITLTSGTLDTNSKTVSCQSFNLGNTTTRTLTLGSSSIAVTLVGGSAVTGTAITNLTVTVNTAIFTLNGAASGVTSLNLNFQGASLVLSGSGTQYVSGSATFGNLTRTGTAAKTDIFEVRADLNVTEQASFIGNSITNRLLVQSNTLGTPRTITVNGSRAHSNLDLMDIAGAGSASTDLSAITGGSGDCGGNSGYTFTPAQTNYWRSASSALDDPNNWASTSTGAGGSGRVPLPQDIARFDFNSTTGQNVNFRMPRIGTIDFSGWTGITILSNAVTFTIFGNLAMPTGGTITGWNSGQTFGGRSSQTITMNGRAASFTPNFQGPNGTYTFQDAFSSGILRVFNGTVNTNSQAVSVATFGDSGTATRAITLGTSTVSLTTTTPTNIWAISSAGLSLSAGSSTITVTTATTNTRTFQGVGLTYGTISYTVAASTGTLIITGANSFTNLTVTSEAGNAKTLTMPSTTINTITGTLTLNGVSANHLILNSSTPGSQATISAGPSATINVNYVDIQDSNVIGGARFFDHDGNSTSNNTGWLFVTVVSDTITFNWQNTIAISKLVAYRWNVTTSVGKQRQLIWNVRNRVGDQTQAIWNNRQIVGDQDTFNWQARISRFLYLELDWQVRHVLNDDLQIPWNVRTSIGKQENLRWNDRHIIGDQDTFNWQARSVSPKDVNLEWSLRHILHDDIQFAWNTRKFIGKPIVLTWQDRIFVGDQIGFLWNLSLALNIPIELLWELSRYMSNPSSSTTLERFDFSEVSLED